MTPQRSQSSRVRTFKPRSVGGVLGGFLGAITMSVVAGVLITAAITPVVAISGAAATSAIKIFNDLPDHLDPGRLAEPSTILAKSGDDLVPIATFYDQNRKMVDWGDISQYAKDAAVSEEDPRFYTHGGIDVLAAGRAIVQNASGSGFSGASTITMQYVRNVLIQEAMSVPDEEEQKKAYNNAMRKDIDRKLKEMKLAVSVEKEFSKDEILLGYLNIALFGRQIYGIESASQYYYSTSAKNLTLPQAASVVAIVNNPSLYQLDVPENIPQNQKRRDKILNSMLREGKITQTQHDEAIKTPVEPHITPRIAGCNIAEHNYGLGHFCDYVQKQILHDPQFGKTPAERQFNFSRGGYNINTTIDLDMQAAGREGTSATVPPLMEGIKAGSASTSVEVGTGRILAMLQNRPFNNSEDFLKEHPEYTTVNYSADEDYGGSVGFQVGSTFKPVTLSEWFRTGHSVRDIVNVNARTVQESSFKASCLPNGVYGFGSFSFTNDNLGTRGNQPVLTAIAQSVNGGLVSMQQKMDLCGTFETAKKLGIHRASKQPNPDVSNYDTTDLSVIPSNIYGGIDEISPLTMAVAYSAFAGGGTVCTPTAIDSITDSDGKAVPFTKSKCTEALSPEVAAGVAYTLEYTVTNGLARHARSAHGIPHLAKTGTTDNIIDNWTIGASTRVATATWVGNTDPVCLDPNNPATCARVSTRSFGRLMFADQTIWPAIMNVADAKYGGDPFPKPSEALVRQTMVQVPDVKGKSFEDAKNMLTALGFSVTDGGEIDSSIPSEMIARSDPEAGASIGLGSGVTLYRSNGKGITVPDGLIGISGEKAKKKLINEGFSSIEFVCEGSQAGNTKHKVVSVDPASGADAGANTTITLTLACVKED